MDRAAAATAGQRLIPAPHVTKVGTRILISQATKDRLTIDVPMRLVGEAHVKGRKQPVVVYEVGPSRRAS